jgi:hypothetical protein
METTRKPVHPGAVFLQDVLVPLEVKMNTGEFTAEDAEKLAARIEAASERPKETARFAAEKLGLQQGMPKGFFRTILDFIKSYKAKDPDTKPEDWLAAEYAKPEYAEHWEGRDSKESAAGICEGIADYEAAKRDLEQHIAGGGTRESWLAAQVEIGAEANGADPKVYAAQVNEGMAAAIEENAELLPQSAKGGQI